MSYIEVIGFCKKYFLKEDLCFEDGLTFNSSPKNILSFSLKDWSSFVGKNPLFITLNPLNASAALI